MLREARERFPGLTYESSTRHVGFGLVIEEARVRDVAAEAEAALAAEVDDAARATEEEVRAEIHPMWDEPVRGRTLRAGAVERGRSARPAAAAGAAEHAGPGDRPARRPPGARGRPELPGRAAEAGARAVRRPARDVAERGAVGVHRPGRGRVHDPRPGGPS